MYWYSDLLSDLTALFHRKKRSVTYSDIGKWIQPRKRNPRSDVSTDSDDAGPNTMQLKVYSNMTYFWARCMTSKKVLTKIHVSKGVVEDQQSRKHSLGQQEGNWVFRLAQHGCHVLHEHDVANFVFHTWIPHGTYNIFNILTLDLLGWGLCF